MVMAKQNAFLAGWLLSLSAWTGVAMAQPMIETQDRIELDWASMKVRFYGESTLGDTSADFKAVEKQAWQEGLAYMSMNLKTIRDLQFPQEKKAPLETGSLRAISNNSYSVNTIYFSDGRLRIQLENDLTKVVRPSAVPFKMLKAEAASPRHSGILLQIAGKAKPQATYQVINERGQVIFEVADVAKESFDQRFMGVWYAQPTANEQRRFLGDNPVTVQAEVVSEGVFRVKQAEWDRVTAGNERLLQEAKMLLATGRSQAG